MDQRLNFTDLELRDLEAYARITERGVVKRTKSWRIRSLKRATVRPRSWICTSQTKALERYKQRSRALRINE